ncbi:MAG: YgaP-like transmembrane domain [Halorhabdus sp.]
MEKNVGGTDRIVWLVVGVVLLVVALAGFAELITYDIGPVTTLIGSAILGVVGLILIVTGALQQCVINDVLGIDTYQP